MKDGEKKWPCLGLPQSLPRGCTVRHVSNKVVVIAEQVFGVPLPLEFPKPWQLTRSIQHINGLVAVSVVNVQTWDSEAAVGDKGIPPATDEFVNGIRQARVVESEGPQSMGAASAQVRECTTILPAVTSLGVGLHMGGSVSPGVRRRILRHLLDLLLAEMLDKEHALPRTGV